MAKNDPKHRASGGWRDRLEMWRARRKPVATDFESHPEPRSIGLYAKGKPLVAGQFGQKGGVAQPEVAIWDVAFADPEARALSHGFGWLDDLAAVGSQTAMAKAQGWTFDWIARFGQGRGPGFRPELVGRRLIRWINHAPLLVQGRSPSEEGIFLASLSGQVHFLSRRWPEAAAGLNRVEALSAIIIAGLVLTGLSDTVNPALKALATHLEAEVDMGGGIATRNPEDLLDLFTLLTWAEQALAERGRTPPPELLAAMERIAPVLRALRHADGGLARFHGGGRGAEGRLDAALANAGIKPLPSSWMAMVYVRLTGRRTAVGLDAAPPSQRSALAHASIG
ncbi:MAG: heparinase, partial [Pseudomonadota bacterium]